MSHRNPVLWLTLLAFSFVIGMQAQEKHSCTNATLHGSYGLHAVGTEANGDPAHVVGRFTFDGKGNLTGQLFARIAGTNLEPPVFSGTYSVNPNCIVTDTWGAPINTTHVSVIVDSGKIYFILNNTEGTGETISAEATRQ
jgi:hypothetical protein